MNRDEQAAKEVLWKEALINEKDIEIDEYATRLLALYQPMARDMRFLTAVIKINGDLERMGDLAVNITQRALSLMREPPVKPLIDIPQMAGLAEDMVRKSLDALVKRDEDLARGVLLSDDEVDRLRDAVYKELVAFMQEQSTTIPRAVDLMFIAHNLERIADHATNIAEDVLFLVKGIDVRHHSEVREHEPFQQQVKGCGHPYNGELEPVSHYYYSDRLKLQFWDWGQDGLPPLLLVHGGLDHARNWDWVARSLREHFHVYAMDLRGHGNSAWAPGAIYSIAEHVLDIATLVDLLIRRTASRSSDRSLAGRNPHAGLPGTLSGSRAQGDRHRGPGAPGLASHSQTRAGAPAHLDRERAQDGKSQAAQLSEFGSRRGTNEGR